MTVRRMAGAMAPESRSAYRRRNPLDDVSTIQELTDWLVDSTDQVPRRGQ
jgi:hypothetical protein